MANWKSKVVNHQSKIGNRKSKTIRWRAGPITRLSTIYQKQKGLGMDCESFAKINIIANKAVSSCMGSRVRGKKGIKKMLPSIAMLLKTNRATMSVFRLARMFMKTGVLCYSCQDVDEK